MTTQKGNVADSTVSNAPRLVEDPAELVAFFGDDPGAHVYALCDLEEPFWSASSWWRKADAVVGLVQIPGDSGVTVYAVATRDQAATLRLLGDLEPLIRPGELLTGPVGMADRLGAERELAWSAPHLRYHLADDAKVPSTDPRVTPLGPEHSDAVATLYNHEPGAAFYRRRMLDDGCFVGVFDADDTLLAAAGTHVVGRNVDAAAVGAVYTRPSHRGQGLGGLVTVGAVNRARLKAGLIALNVAEGNGPARRIYERVGFEATLRYEEAELAS